jgi:hypothetical protein
MFPWASLFSFYFQILCVCVCVSVWVCSVLLCKNVIFITEVIKNVNFLADKEISVLQVETLTKCLLFRPHIFLHIQYNNEMAIGK